MATLESGALQSSKGGQGSSSRIDSCREGTYCHWYEILFRAL